VTKLEWFVNKWVEQENPTGTISRQSLEIKLEYLLKDFGWAFVEWCNTRLSDQFEGEKAYFGKHAMAEFLAELTQEKEGETK